MNTVYQLVRIAFWIVLIWSLIEGVRVLRGLPLQVQSAVEVMDRRLASVEKRLDRHMYRITDRLDNRVGEVARSVADLAVKVEATAVQAESTLRQVEGAVADVRRTHSTFAARMDYWTDCENNGLCWQGAATDTLLAVRRAALTIDRSVPQIVEASQATANSVAATADASARTAANLAQITKPAPRWARYLGIGLGVAAPAAQVALPFVIRRP